MFVACGIWCLADVSSVSPSSEQTAPKRQLNTISHRRQTYHINLVDQTHILKTNRLGDNYSNIAYIREAYIVTKLCDELN